MKEKGENVFQAGRESMLSKSRGGGEAGRAEDSVWLEPRMEEEDRWQEV